MTKKSTLALALALALSPLAQAAPEVTTPAMTALSGPLPCYGTALCQCAPTTNLFGGVNGSRCEVQDHDWSMRTQGLGMKQWCNAPDNTATTCKATGKTNLVINREIYGELPVGAILKIAMKCEIPKQAASGTQDVLVPCTIETTTSK